MLTWFLRTSCSKSLLLYAINKMAHHLFHNSCLVYIARYQLSDKHVPMCALTRLAVGFRRMMSWSCLKHHFLQFLLNYIFLSKFFFWKLTLYFSVIIYLKKLNTINTCMQIRTLKYSTHIFLKLKLHTCTWVPQLLKEPSFFENTISLRFF